jgi:hypothetical protein
MNGGIADMLAGIRRKKLDLARLLFLLQQSNHGEFKRLRGSRWRKNKGAATGRAPLTEFAI